MKKTKTTPLPEKNLDRIEQDKSSQVKSSQVKSSQVKSSQVKSSPDILFLIESITSRSTPGVVRIPGKRDRIGA